jgi:hypothetical protein
MNTRLTLSLLALLRHCQPGPQTTWPQQKSAALVQSAAGAFQPNPQQTGQLVYLKPGADLKTVSRLILEPLSFIERQNDGQWQLLVAEQNKIDSLPHEHGNRAAQGAHIAVVPSRARCGTPASCHYRFSAGQTGLAVSDFIPIKAAFNLARFATGTEPYLLKVSTMGQLEDAQSTCCWRAASTDREPWQQDQGRSHHCRFAKHDYPLDATNARQLAQRCRQPVMGSGNSLLTSAVTIRNG